MDLSTISIISTIALTAITGISLIWQLFFDSRIYYSSYQRDTRRSQEQQLVNLRRYSSSYGNTWISFPQIWSISASSSTPQAASTPCANNQLADWLEWMDRFKPMEARWGFTNE